MIGLFNIYVIKNDEVYVIKAAGECKFNMSV